MKRLVKHTLIGVAFSGAVLLSTSCTDLTEKLYDQLNETNIDLTDDATINSLMGQAIAQYRYMQLSWFGNWEMQEQCTDLYMVPYRIGVGWGDLYVNLHRHDWDYNLGHAENVWGYAYACIGYCNQVLDIMEGDEFASRRAQLRFFRAMTYYSLLDSFRNVPLETTQDVEEGYLPEQNTPQEIYDFCVSELTAIKDDIGTEKNFGYGNRYTCCMALAKLYLNRGVYLGLSDNTEGYEAALSEVNEVINDGGYTLSPNYSDNFREDLSDNNEIIFAVPQDRTHATHFLLHTYAVPQVGLDAFGCTATATNGSCAVPQFIDTYDADDKRFDQTWTGGKQRYAVQNSDGTYTPEAGDYIPYEEDDWNNEGILCYSKDVHSIDNPGAYKQEGYRIIKYEIVAGQYGTSSDDIAIFRLADAMFIKAECLLRLGRDTQTAADLITEVRARDFDNASKATRTVADLQGGSVYDYGHREYTCEGYANWDRSYYVSTVEGGDDIELGGLLDDLAWEFCCELHRRQDLIRFKMKDGRSVFTGKSWFCKDAQTDDHWEIFAIPYAYMSGNPNLKQNPGYSGAQ
ncbi:MAG: RagB/SusD family nutrient uptake outer membrane protein [Prevotellaceae bacterium]|nr:RagB/SusD family nutrient uptake outer membrane protein [Prevotellaceae bacterium]